MKDGQYVVIQSFMVSDLQLKGNELIVYAVIFGYTQDGEHWFYGTKGYLSEWCGATKGTVGNCLRALIDKGLIERREKIEHGQTKIEYRVTKNVTPPYKNCESPHTNFVPINKIEDSISRKAKNMDAVQQKPTVEDVRAYVQEHGYHFDPDHFFAYYEASGWHFASGKPVKSWKQCCVTWERNWKRNESTDRRSKYTEQQNAEFDLYSFSPDQIVQL